MPRRTKRQVPPEENAKKPKISPAPDSPLLSPLQESQPTTTTTTTIANKKLKISSDSDLSDSCLQGGASIIVQRASPASHEADTPAWKSSALSRSPSEAPASKESAIDLKEAKEELEKAKEELEKAKEELEKAENKLDKAKEELKEARASENLEDIARASRNLDRVENEVATASKTMVSVSAFKINLDRIVSTLQTKAGVLTLRSFTTHAPSVSAAEGLFSSL